MTHCVEVQDWCVWIL